MINNPADTLLHMSIHMPRWRVLVRPKDRDLLDAALGKIRKLQAWTKDGG
jgi:hypothetical protein